MVGENETEICGMGFGGACGHCADLCAEKMDGAEIEEGINRDNQQPMRL